MLASSTARLTSAKEHDQGTVQQNRVQKGLSGRCGAIGDATQVTAACGPLCVRRVAWATLWELVRDSRGCIGGTDAPMLPSASDAAHCLPPVRAQC